MSQSRSTLNGAVYGLLAATLFGLSVPVAKVLLPETTPLVLAGLLYLGGGLGLLGIGAVRRLRPPAIRGQEASLQRRDVPLVAAIALLGGVAGPVLMLSGLERVSALAGSLLLNLEGPITVLAALLIFGEHLGRSTALAVALVFTAAVLLGIEEGSIGGEPLGALEVAGACLAWALDNNLTQRLSVRDPLAIARVKCLSAGLCSLALAAALGQHLPSAGLLASAGLAGVFSYGVSLLLDTYALRHLGAAREAAFFSAAPFIGALASLVVLGEAVRFPQVIAAVLMLAGVALLLREKHSHVHVHAALEHEHLHRHDDHHRHAHSDASAVDGAQAHSHPHVHEETTHEHPHASDIHHRHRH